MTLGHVGLRRRGLAYGLAAALTLAPVGPVNAAAGHVITGSNAATAGRMEEPTAPTARDQLGPMTNIEMQGYGCLAAGGVTTALTVLTGTDQLILVFAGGTVTPTTPVGAAIAVTGMIFASVCAVGALATPAIVRLWKYYYIGMPLAPTP